MPWLTLENPNRSALIRVVALSESTFDKLRVAFENLPSTTDRSRLLQAVSSQIDDLSGGDVEEIVNAFTFLHSLLASSDGPFEHFVADVRDAMGRGLSETTVTGEKDKGLLFSRVSELLRADGFRWVAKALDLRFEYPRIFQNVRILTDLRPVFDSRGDLAVHGGLISNTLKINYYSDEGAKEFYVSLDADDIRSIRKAIDRAENKARILRRFLSKASIRDLDERENDGSEA